MSGIFKSTRFEYFNTVVGGTSYPMRLINQDNTAGAGVGIELALRSQQDYRWGISAKATSGTPSPLAPVLYFNSDNGAGSYTTVMAMTESSVYTSVPMQIAAGSASLPAYSFNGDENCGLWRSGTDTVRMATGGLEVMGWGSGQEVWIMATKRFFLDSGVNTYIVESSSDVISIVSGSVTAATISNGGCSLLGTTTNDSAAAGFVGQYIESVVGLGNVAASGALGDSSSISLTAGDWDVTAQGDFVLNTGVSITRTSLGISSTSGNSSTGLVSGSNLHDSAAIPTAAAQSFITVGSYRVSIASTTTFYLKTRVNYSSGNPQFAGRISARRVR